MRYQNFIVFLAFSLLIIFSSPGRGEVSNPDEFGSIIILDKGRKKPLDTYARNTLLRFSGKQKYKRQSATAWLVRVFFSSDLADSDTVFLVNDMQVIHALGLSLPESRHFSLLQLKKGIGKLQELAGEISKIDEKKRTRLQSDIMRLYHNIRIYYGLQQSFQFAIPEQVFSIKDKNLAAFLGLASFPAKNSYYSLISRTRLLHNYSKVSNSSNSSANGGTVEPAQLQRRLDQWTRHYVNMPVHIIPLAADGNESWKSPWDVLHSNTLRSDYSKELDALQRIAVSYADGNQNTFDLECAAFRSLIEKRLSDTKLMSDIKLELNYNKVNPFFWSKLLLILGLLISLSVAIFWRKEIYLSGILITISSLIPLIWGMWARMIIMGRPPVTNLYETFLFVGLTSVLVGLCMEWFQRRGLGLITAGFSGLLMLMIAGKYAKDGDTLGMLVAVLDSNFWLATHVITITMGYGGCIAAGVAGHIYIIQELFNADKVKLKNTGKTIYGVLAFGLLFTFIGTVLGGIWADQSWGRFWGWDPKENGALLIVIWCAILFHARLDGMIKDLGIAAGSIIGVLIVMFAWFGVNLLGVGLHSYGFSGGVFWKLVIYFSLEVIFLIFAIGWIYQKRTLTKNITIK